MRGGSAFESYEIAQPSSRIHLENGAKVADAIAEGSPIEISVRGLDESSGRSGPVRAVEGNEGVNYRSAHGWRHGNGQEQGAKEREIGMLHYVPPIQPQWREATQSRNSK